MARIKNRDFGLRQHLYQGAGCVSELREIIVREGWKKIFFVCGPSQYKRGYAAPIEEQIRGAGAEISVFTNIRENPEAVTIEREAIPQALAFKADAIVAMGGGSTLDTAKGVVIVGDSGKHVLDFTVSDIAPDAKLNHNVLPMVAIPTTAGTGSEVCKNAVISDENGIKLVLAHESILPKYALLDPNMLKTLPRGVAAATAMDTFVQALETYTNRNANEFTRAQSLRSLELIGQCIRGFVANRADEESANNMSLACMFAGFSLGLSGIGQDHIITHPMSESPFYMAHGDACAMVLPAVIEYNGMACKPLYCKAYNALTGKNLAISKFEVQQLIDWVVELNADLHIAGDKSFYEWGLNEETLAGMLKHPIIVNSANRNADPEISEYPRMTNIDDFRAIIKRAAWYSKQHSDRAKAKAQ